MICKLLSGVQVSDFWWPFDWWVTLIIDLQKSLGRIQNLNFWSFLIGDWSCLVICKLQSCGQVSECWWLSDWWATCKSLDRCLKFWNSERSCWMTNVTWSANFIDVLSFQDFGDFLSHQRCSSTFWLISDVQPFAKFSTECQQLKFWNSLTEYYHTMSSAKFYLGDLQTNECRSSSIYKKNLIGFNNSNMWQVSYSQCSQSCSDGNEAQ